MMHHPNMHHQQMSGHPPQHLGGHQGMPAHHQIPPHQMHGENRHVVLPRMAMGPTQASGLGSMAMSHHGPAQRPPHPIRAMHHTPGPHHRPPPSVHTNQHNQGGMKTMRRGFLSNSTYGGGANVVKIVSYPQPTRVHPPPTVPSLCRTTSPPVIPQTNCARTFGHISSMCRPPSPTAIKTTSTTCNSASGFGVPSQPTAPPPATSPPSSTAPLEADTATHSIAHSSGPQDSERAQLVPNSKEKTPMCLVNELARYNKIKHQYRLTSETGPAHKKVFTVTLRLGDTEEYTAEGSSIKRAQHAAAGAALTKTTFSSPPPRHAPAHDHTHHRHAGAVMPTVELNALAMKLCLPVEYSALPPAPRVRPPTHYRIPYLPNYNQRMMSPSVIYRVRVTVGGQMWLGEGGTPQAARHDAAARALTDLRPAPPHPPPALHDDAQANAATNNGDVSADGADFITSEVKSPVSLVHELALKKNLGVVFSVKSERGPPHMRVFVTSCTVGELETEGEGNGKKVSKRRAAQLMLDEMRRRWPSALLRARPPSAAKRKPVTGKRKSRNLIKTSAESNGPASADNPISRLAQARQCARAPSPVYRLVEERGLARRREFVVLCDAPPHSATGHGPNKKAAKRRAAHNVLLAMELGPGEMTSHNGDHTETRTPATTNESTTEENRQPLPGVLLMDNNYHHHNVSNNNHTAPTSTSPTSSTSGTGAKDQLLYLAQLMGFTVQFSDFPKRNRGSYLSLVSLSTTPPVMCHGGGTSTASSHEHCARNALGALAKMGLDGAPACTERIQNPGTKPTTAITNGVSE